MGLAITGWLRLIQLLRDDAEVKLGFDGNAGGDEAPDVVIDEMLTLGMFPILRVQGEGSGSERVVVLLGEFGKRDVLEAVETLEFFKLSGGSGEPKEEKKKARNPTDHGSCRSYNRASRRRFFRSTSGERT